MRRHPERVQAPHQWRPGPSTYGETSLSVQLVGMLDMSVPVVAKLKRLLDSLPRDTLPDVVASMIRASDKEKLQVRWTGAPPEMSWGGSDLAVCPSAGLGRS